jgi:prepilin-type N-terminal cleavage/methylation domain-containing protein
MLCNRHEKGFTLIEILIVVAIIGILTAVTVPAYVGILERGRKGGVIRAAEGSRSVLQAWLHASRRIGPEAALTQVDTNGNGRIEVGIDQSNSELATELANANGLCILYEAIRPEQSPWNPALAMWKSGGPAPGQIDCSHAPNGSITLSAQDNTGITFYMTTVAAD